MHLLPLVLAALLTVAMPPPSSAAILEILVNTDKQLAVLAVKRLYSKRVPSSAVNGHLPPDDEGDVVFEFDNGEVSRCQLLREPATIHAEDFHDHGEIHEAETGEASHMLCAGYANDTARSVAVRQGSKRLRYTLTEGHTFHSLQSDSLVHKTMQYVGPVESQTNLIFLSAGYLADQSDAFFSDVSKAMNLLQFPTSDSIPLSRYFSASNVFAVFQASVDQGASNPQRGVTKNNNLQCSYGETSERLLTCDVATCFALAATAPVVAGAKNNIVVTLVDDTTYGGAAVFNSVIHITWFYNAALRQSDSVDLQRRIAGSLFYHESGHAIGKLMDEYSLGIRGNTGKVTPNCYWESSGLPWAEWISRGEVPANPSAVCGYTNYFKATDICMMGALDRPGLCAVCREALSTAMYDIGMSIMSPTCPHHDEVVYLNPTSNATFYANNKLIRAGEYELTWLVDSVAVAGATKTFFIINGSDFGTSYGTHTVKLIVKDTTSWVLTNNRVGNMEQSLEWAVQFVASETAMRDVKAKECPSTGALFNLQLNQLSYRATCANTTSNCTLAELVTSSQEAFVKEVTASSLLANNVFGSTGILVLSFSVTGMLIWFSVARHYAAQPLFIRELVHTSKAKYQRIFLVGFALVWCLVALVGIAFCVGLHEGLANVVPKIVAGMISFTCINAATAFVLFTSALFVARRALYIGAGMTGVTIFVYILACVFCLLVGFTVSSNDSWASGELQNIWAEAAQSHAGKACQVQAYLECSGWDIACSRIQNEWCPAGCEQTNSLYTIPCREPLSDLMQKYCLLFGWIGIAVIVLLAGIVYCCVTIARFLLSISDEYEQQKIECQTALSRITVEERRRLVDNFNRLDTNGDGIVEKKDFLEYYPKIAGFDVTRDDLEAAWRAVDVNHDEAVTFPEFVRFLSNPQVRAEMVAPLDKASPAFDEAYEKSLQVPQSLLFQMYTVYRSMTSTGDTLDAFVTYYDGRAEEPLIVEMFQNLDADSDKHLSWTDFVARYDVWKEWLSNVVASDAVPRLRRFYERYAPDKLALCQDILTKWDGKEEQLFETLVKKYGPEPSQTVDQAFQRRLERFCNHYNLKKHLRYIDTTLERKAGQEQQLLTQLVEKYGPEPTFAPDDLDQR